MPHILNYSPCLQGQTEGVTCSAGTYGEPSGLRSAKGTTEQPLTILPAPSRWVSSRGCPSRGWVKAPLTAPCSHSHGGPVTSLGILRQYSIVTQPKLLTKNKTRNCLFPIWRVLPILRPLLCPSPPSTSLCPLPP